MSLQIWFAHSKKYLRDEFFIGALWPLTSKISLIPNLQKYKTVNLGENGRLGTVNYQVASYLFEISQTVNLWNRHSEASFNLPKREENRL